MDPPDSTTTTSSPRSARPDTIWDAANAAKLRLRCSYGGHIIPRPHDKSLCYVGGETRIVVVDRLSSLAELHSRLSHTLLNGRHFTLKYQLPNEDLDSLISLASDEDLENMIDEYDRTTSASSNLKPPSRLRLFLFPTKPETAASMGCLLDDAKSETWFVDALNGSGLLPRGHSDSAAIDDTLLDLDNTGGGIMVKSDSNTDIEAQNNTNIHDHDNQSSSSLGHNNNENQVTATTKGGFNNVQEVVCVDSPTVVDMSSSFGSSSSPPSMANLPPIKVRADQDYNQMAGLDEHLSQLNMTSQPPPNLVATKAGASTSCDDDKSDPGNVPPSGMRRKPPLPIQTVQRNKLQHVDTFNLPSPDSKNTAVAAAAGGYNFPSPDSVASDCSIASAGSLSKHAVYQEATQLVNRDNRVQSPTVDEQRSSPQEPVMVAAQHQQLQHVDSMYPQHQQPQHVDSMYPPHQQPQHVDSMYPPHQQQYIHPSSNTHYIQHQHPGVQAVPSYYPVYLTSQTPQSIHHQTPPHHDPQYPMYLLPPLAQAQPPPNSTIAPYQTTKPELAANMYPPPHPQYIGYSQTPAAPQPTNASAAIHPNYGGYEYSHGGYYAAPPPHQYQSMTPAAAAAMLSQASTTPQIPAGDSNAQQS